VFPDAKENFLANVFGLGSVTKHPAGESDHAWEMPANELRRRTLVAGSHPLDQFFIRITHCVRANSHRRSAAKNGKYTKAEPVTTLCILPQHLPSVSCLRLQRFSETRNLVVLQLIIKRG
jgi:hypothetical protein